MYLAEKLEEAVSTLVTSPERIIERVKLASCVIGLGLSTVAPADEPLKSRCETLLAEIDTHLDMDEQLASQYASRIYSLNYEFK